MKTIRCFLKPGKEKPLEGFHPWVFSGALDRIDDDYKAGDLIKVFSSDERFLGIGYLNPRSQIAIRMLTFEETEITATFFEKKIRRALALRSMLFESTPSPLLGISGPTTGFRLIHSEGDGLPGLIVDRYGDFLVAQFLTVGMEKWKAEIVGILQKLLPVKGIFEKDDTDLREWEGLEERVGKLSGEEPPDYVEIQENGLKFIVDIHRGQKTGFFLDQRTNRALARQVSAARRVLNCFSYSGGFSVAAAAGGASETVSVDTSEPALNTAKMNLERNGFSGAEHSLVREDVFNYLRSVRQEFDFIILDPPAFCKSKQQIHQASRGYKDINLLGLKRLAPGGLLLTCSCSSHIDPDLFQKIVFAAAKDARRPVRILAKTSNAPDHPVNIYHPEGEYLKGLLCEVD